MTLIGRLVLDLKSLTQNEFQCMTVMHAVETILQKPWKNLLCLQYNNAKSR